MDKTIFQKANEFLRARTKKQRRGIVLGALAALVALGTTAALTHPALTLGGTVADSVTVKATKSWSGLTPKASDAVTVELWSNENGSWAKVPTAAAGTMSMASGWGYQWEGLPGKTASGSAISYQVRETQVAAGGSNTKIENTLDGDKLSGSASTANDIFTVSYADPVDEVTTETTGGKVDPDLSRNITVARDSSVSGTTPPAAGAQYRFGDGTSSITLNEDGTVSFEKNVPNPTSADPKSGDAMRRQLWTVLSNDRGFALVSVYNPKLWLDVDTSTGKVQAVEGPVSGIANSPRTSGYFPVKSRIGALLIQANLYILRMTLIHF